MASRAEIKTKMDKVKDEIIRQAQEWGGNQWFSNDRTRKEIVNNVDGMTMNTLNYYIRAFKGEGFLSYEHPDGRGWSIINLDKK